MPGISIRELEPGEGEALGRLMVAVYSALDGFPSPAEQPRYYDMLANISRMTERPGARVLVATVDGRPAGGVVYFSDMAHYGSGGVAAQLINTSGIRLLAVRPASRGQGIGRALTMRCFALAREAGHAAVVLHTTGAMQVAWKMYEDMGFMRVEELDFRQESLPVYGFRLPLT